VSVFPPAQEEKDGVTERTEVSDQSEKQMDAGPDYFHGSKRMEEGQNHPPI